MRAKWALHAGKVGPGRLCPVFCPTLPKPWAKWAIVFISIYLTCLIYIIRYRLKRASIAYHMHISRHSCNYLICGRQFIYPMCRNSCTARFARPSPTPSVVRTHVHLFITLATPLVKDFGLTLKQHWLNAKCLCKVYNRPGYILVLGQHRNDWPAGNQQ